MAGQGRASRADPSDANQRTFAAPRVVAEYVRAGQGWLEAGERRAILTVADRCRGRPILELGIGAGRTTALMLLLSDRYLGLDYAPTMVAAARAAIPEADLRVGDARELRGIADASQQLVTFAYNGLDALTPADRRRALAEVARVLADGGYWVYSALNLDGPTPRERPWRLPASVPGASRPRRLIEIARALVRMPRRVAAYRRTAGAATHGDDTAMLPMPAHDYGLLVHYARPTAIRRELAEHGFALEALIAPDGERLDPAATGHPHSYLHIVARRAR